MSDGELLDNLALYVNRQSLTRMILIFDLYKEITNVQEDILEFGVRWAEICPSS
jgi:hypothetical protein